jgi:hypothetical protein
MLYSIILIYFSVWILESLRQGLHVVASWDYHRGAKIRGSVRGNPGRFRWSMAICLAHSYALSFWCFVKMIYTYAILIHVMIYLSIHMLSAMLVILEYPYAKCLSILAAMFMPSFYISLLPCLYC